MSPHSFWWPILLFVYSFFSENLLVHMDPLIKTDYIVSVKWIYPALIISLVMDLKVASDFSWSQTVCNVALLTSPALHGSASREQSVPGRIVLTKGWRSQMTDLARLLSNRFSWFPFPLTYMKAPFLYILKIKPWVWFMFLILANLIYEICTLVVPQYFYLHFSG